MACRASNGVIGVGLGRVVESASAGVVAVDPAGLPDWQALTTAARMSGRREADIITASSLDGHPNGFAPRGEADRSLATAHGSGARRGHRSASDTATGRSMLWNALVFRARRPVPRDSSQSRFYVRLAKDDDLVRVRPHDRRVVVDAPAVGRLGESVLVDHDERRQ